MAIYDFDDFGPYIEGAWRMVDISAWQWNDNINCMPDFDNLASHFDAAIIRAGSINNITGVPYTDYKFNANYLGVSAEGHFEKIGAYWYVRLNHDPAIQAQYFANLVRGKGFDILVADAETAGQRSVLFQFLTALKALLPEENPLIWIYTGPNAWNNKITGTKSPALEYGLWEAHYQVNTPMGLEPWHSAGVLPRAHQFTDDGPGLSWGTCSNGLDLSWVHPDVFGEPVPEPPFEPYVVRTLTSLNVRVAPGYPLTRKIGAVPVNTYFTVVDEEGVWLGVVCWVHGGYTEEV